MKIKKEVIDKLIEHAKRDAPVEACGYLARKDDIITAHYELLNIDKSEEHFSFDPKDQFATVKDARTKGLEVCAVYHSHPQSPARPSPEDLKLAFDPNMSYVIVSLAGGEEDVKSFRITGSKLEPEELEVI
ncbi:MAG: M67 family metallopeptidase [Candidatus Omnitrophota bacterium]